MLETEAIKRWCPFARVSFPSGNSANRISAAVLDGAEREALRTGDNRDWLYYQNQERDCACIGSKCMAWRESTIQDGFTNRGYCGLAQ